MIFFAVYNLTAIGIVMKKCGASCWTAAPGQAPSECQGYHPSAQYSSGTPSTFPLLLEDTEFSYDEVDNPVEIHRVRPVEPIWREVSRAAMSYA